jgi:hypothetical protein
LPSTAVVRNASFRTDAGPNGTLEWRADVWPRLTAANIDVVSKVAIVPCSIGAGDRFFSSLLQAKPGGYAVSAKSIDGAATSEFRHGLSLTATRRI